MTGFGEGDPFFATCRPWMLAETLLALRCLCRRRAPLRSTLAIPEISSSQVRNDAAGGEVEMGESGVCVERRSGGVGLIDGAGGAVGGERASAGNLRS